MCDLNHVHSAACGVSRRGLLAAAGGSLLGGDGTGPGTGRGA
ncbi:unnamed protein product [Gemmataceae bacterium]|nr:unnamed protein product [Gemmataceae bacterium]VTT96803.1 unnamed protein product [Gemmataceae bacterium]